MKYRYEWTCRLCGGVETLNVQVDARQSLSYKNSDGSVRSWALADAGVSGIEHTCPPATIARSDT